MVMVKCAKRIDDCQYIWNYLGKNGNEKKYITCPSCHYKINKRKAIQSYNDWKKENKKEAEMLEKRYLLYSNNNYKIDKTEQYPEEIEQKVREKETKIKKKKPIKKGKIDLEALGFNENFACPNCKEMISFYFFADMFFTVVGSLKDVIESDYNADSEFMRFVLERHFEEDIYENTKVFIKNKLKDLYKKFEKEGK